MEGSPHVMLKQTSSLYGWGMHSHFCTLSSARSLYIQKEGGEEGYLSPFRPLAKAEPISRQPLPPTATPDKVTS